MNVPADRITPVPITQAPCALLPRAAREELIQATRVKDPHFRLVAIDAAIDAVKLRYPQFFQPQPESE